MIDTSRGGATVETWTPEDKMKAMEARLPRKWVKKWEDDIANWDPKTALLKRIEGKKTWLEKMEKEGREVSAKGRIIPSDQLLGPIVSKNSLGYSYAGMITPLEGLSIKGVIWHQGYNSALGDLQAEGNKDLPLATQRSDDWPDHTVPLGVLPEDVDTSQPLTRGDKGKLLKALREMDKRRKIAEAKATLQEFSSEK